MAEHDDWYTPPEIFTALGLRFDLDPCSPGAKHWVPAWKIYTTADDGLRQPWGAGLLQSSFWRSQWPRAVADFLNHGGGVESFRSSMSSAWWRTHMLRAQMILFPAKGKTKFIRPDGAIGTAPGHGVVLIGMGAVACTARLRSELGMVWHRRGFH
jgi:hypothetical protein